MRGLNSKAVHDQNLENEVEATNRGDVLKLFWKMKNFNIFLIKIIENINNYFECFSKNIEKLRKIFKFF